MKNTILTASILLLQLSSISAQPWMKYLEEKKKLSQEQATPDFFSIQKAFNTYMVGREPSKTPGYKQFKRWENYMESRVKEDGYLDSRGLWELIKATNEGIFEDSLIVADWEFVGPSKVPTWENSGELMGIGRLNCIAFHPSDSNTFYVGAPAGGIWKTEDGGHSWSSTTDGLDGLGISDIKIHPANDSIIYAGTGDRDGGDTHQIGLIKSLDQGKTWEIVNIGTGYRWGSVNRLLIHPEHPDTIIIATDDEIMFSHNGGLDMDEARTTDSVYSLDDRFMDLEFQPGNPMIVYASTFDGDFYKSENGGLTFYTSNTGMIGENTRGRMEIAVSQANPDIVYALCSDNEDWGFHSFYKSINAGESWFLIYDNGGHNLLGRYPESTGGQSWYNQSLTVSPTNPDEIFVGGVMIWQSDDGGFSWEQVNDGVHVDHHWLDYSPFNSGLLYSCNDGGIRKTYSKGNSWIDISEDLGIHQVYRLAISRKTPGNLLTGAQDNGSSLKNGHDWVVLQGGDGMECHIDYLDDNIRYVTAQNGLIFKNEEGGSWIILPEYDLVGTWITPLFMHPENSRILYAGLTKNQGADKGNYIYRTVDTGETWKRLSLNARSTIYSITIAPGNDDYIYVNTTDRYNDYYSIDGGNTWENGNGADIVNPNNPAHHWLAENAFIIRERDLYSSIDNNLTTDQGLDYTYQYGYGNYLNERKAQANVQCMIYEKGTYHGIYLGTDIGVFYRNGSMDSWVYYNQGLPKVSVMELEIDYNTGELYAATFGRGVWKTPLWKDTSSVNMNFSVDFQQGCPGSEFTFTNTAVNKADSVLWRFGSGAEPSVSRSMDEQVTVTYSQLGEKSVSLTVFKNGRSYYDKKNNLVKIVENPEIRLAEDTIVTCGPVHLHAFGSLDLTWKPSEGLITSSGNTVIANPNTSTSYTVRLNNENCPSEKQVHVIKYNTSNDNLCDAIEIVPGINGPFSNFCAGVEEREPFPVFDNEEIQKYFKGEALKNTVWFKFQATGSGNVSLSIVNKDNNFFDSKIALYKAASCLELYSGTYELITGSTTGGGWGENRPWGMDDIEAAIDGIQLIPGQYYWLQVDGKDPFLSVQRVIGEELVEMENEGEFYIEMKEMNVGVESESIKGSAESLELRPNPATREVTVILNESKQSGINKVSIFSMSGLLVSEESIPHKGVYELAINLEGLNPGIYIVKVQTDEAFFERKLVIE